MRVYASALEMIKEVERDLQEMGTRYQSATVQDMDVSQDEAFQTVELFGYGYVLTKIDDEDDLRAMISHTDPDGGKYGWALLEADDRVQSRAINPGGTWRKDEALWGKYIRRGRFAYTYNERIREQLHRVIDELRERPNTRQAIITIYDRHQDMDSWGGGDRVPCSMHYQFVVREGKLCVLYCMRSCDLLKHFATDVYLASSLARTIARATNKPTGHLVHFIGSLHAFRGDLEKRGIF